MAHLIDKSALVAEIEKIYNKDYKFLPSDIAKNIQDFKDDVLRNIDTIEVKEAEENYIQHYNMWWWGKTITLIHNKGWASVEIQFDNNYPNVAFIKSLIAFEYKRKEGIGTDLLLLSEELVKSHGKRFIQLSADISKKWLVKWYEKNGYVIIYKDEHEYTMLKTLK